MCLRLAQPAQCFEIWVTSEWSWREKEQSTGKGKNKIHLFVSFQFTAVLFGHLLKLSLISGLKYTQIPKVK